MLAPNQSILNGKYRIIRQLGEGAAARVWLAEEPRFGGRLVAIKELRRDLLTTGELEEQERRFYQEVRLAALLEQARAPHVVRALTVEEQPDGARLLVMAYADGGSLADLLAQHPQGLPIDQAVGIAVQVAEALDALHSLPVEPVHRDVKPSNILLTREGEALLGDFGLAQLAGASGRSLLSGGQHPGTPMTMAPEQERGAGYLTPAADVFALGCVLWEMLTGKRYKRFQPGTPPSQERVDVPAWLDQVVMKALAEDAWNRWSSAGEMARALQAGAATPQPVSSGRQSSRSAVSNVRSDDGAGRRRPAWLGLLAGVIGLMAVVAMMFWVLNGGIGPRGAVASTPVLTPDEVVAMATATNTPVQYEDEPVPSMITLAVPTATSASPSPTPALGIGSTMITQSDGMEYVYVPAGEFLMGSSNDDAMALDNEKPQHRVQLDGFWIARYEVTNAVFARFVEETGYLTDAETSGFGWVFDQSTGRWNQTPEIDWQHPYGPESDLQGLMDHPVVHVSWNDALAYCQWAGCRLPTEAEWEKAARGVEGGMYPWGNTSVAGNLLNFADRNLAVDWADNDADDGYQYTAPVGTYPAGASPYGVMDMAGNVWEWTADWYGESFYAESQLENPTGPGSGSTDVLRGGSWNGDAQYVRTAIRIHGPADYRRGSTGFRPARSP